MIMKFGQEKRGRTAEIKRKAIKETVHTTPQIIHKQKEESRLHEEPQAKPKITHAARSPG